MAPNSTGLTPEEETQLKYLLNKLPQGTIKVMEPEGPIITDREFRLRIMEAVLRGQPTFLEGCSSGEAAARVHHLSLIHI